MRELLRKPISLSFIALALALAWTTAPHRVHAATPNDEKKVEDEIDDDKANNPESLNQPGQKPDDSAVTPPPAAATAPPSAAAASPSTPAPQPGQTPPPAPQAEEQLAPPPPDDSQMPQLKGKEEPPPVMRTEETPITRPTEPEYDGTTRATHSGRGEPIFDWSKHQGELEVEHPFRERGLIRITRDRDYIYTVKESDQSRAMSFRGGLFHPDRLENPQDAGQPGATFDDNYEASNAPAILMTYEWQFWPSAIGKWAFQVGSGFFVAQGHGHFVGGVNAGLTPRETFTFLMIPLNVGMAYRMQFWHRQMVVPYAEGGGSVLSFAELRDDNHGPKAGGTLGAYFAAGGALNLTYFDPMSRIQLDREYGINAVYLTAEFRQLITMQKYDFTSNMLAGGFLMEY